MKPIFRNAVFGFHKEDVAKFIGKQSNLYESKIDELKKQNELLLQTMEEEREEHRACLDRLNECERSAKKYESSIKKLSLLMDDLETELGQLKDGVDRSRISFQKMESNLSMAKDRFQKLVPLCEKAQKFDHLANTLGEIFGNGLGGGKNIEKNEISFEDLSFSSEYSIDDLFASMERMTELCNAVREIAPNDIR